MKDERLDPEEIGKQLGMESVNTVVGKLDAYCAWEERRIELANAPQITALEAEGCLLVEEKKDLEERLRHAPPAFDFRTRKRKTFYYWTVAALLWATGLFSTMMSLAPFRLGWLAGVFCLGMAVASPFLIETALETWNVEKLLKYLATGASVAALASLMCFAVIRGSLLSQQLESSNEAVTLDDGQPTAPAPENRFYEHASPYLVFAMLMAAAAMEIGAGLSLYKAWKLSSNSSDDWEAIRDRLAAVIARLLGITHEIKRLQNEAVIFEARFQRNFYHAMLTHTVRNAIAKLTVVFLGALLLFSTHARASDHLTLVVMLDLTGSMAVAGHDGKTELNKNIDAVTRVLAEMPAGSHVTVFGITDNSFAQPYMLLSADIADDPGYFNERIGQARRSLVQVWQKRSKSLKSGFARTDILGALLLAAQLFHGLPHGNNVIIIFSDMRQNTRDLDLETKPANPDQSLVAVERKGLIADLRDVEVSVRGAHNADRSIGYWEKLKDFWLGYFAKAKAHFEDYSVLRDL